MTEGCTERKAMDLQVGDRVAYADKHADGPSFLTVAKVVKMPGWVNVRLEDESQLTASVERWRPSKKVLVRYEQ